MNIETLMQYMSYILAGIGVLAFLVSVIVQVINAGSKKGTDQCSRTGYITDPDTSSSNRLVYLLSDSN